MIDSFFSTTAHLNGTPEKGIYDLLLVAVSYFVATMGALTSIVLYDLQMRAASGSLRKFLRIGSSISLGGGIWSMHFIGMLAYKMKMLVEYDLTLTAVSLGIAIISVYAALTVLNDKKLNIVRWAIASTLLGFAVCSMHYVGMAAMQMDADLVYDPFLFLISVIIAFTASAAALGLLFVLSKNKSRKKWLWQSIAAIVMGIAVCGMHYTGVAASIFLPYANCRYTTVQNFDDLAILITLVMSFILAIGLITAIYQGEKFAQLKRAHSFFVPAFLIVGALILTALLLAWLGSEIMGLMDIIKMHMAEETRSDDIEKLNILHIKNQRLIYGLPMGTIVLLVFWVYALRTVQKGWVELNASREKFKIQFAEKEKIEIELQEKFREIQAVNQAANHLRTEEQRQKIFLDTILNNIPIPVFVRDAKDNFRWLMINDMAVKKFGYVREEVTGKNDYDFFPKGIADEFRKSDEAVMKSGEVWELPEVMITHNGENFMAHLYKVPIYDEKQTPWMIMTMIEDVSQRVRERNDLRLAKDEAEQANIAKSEFLANMSHELRTPLNSILGMSQLILEDPLASDEHKEMLTVSYKAGQSLLALVNDILDLSKIEARGVALEKIPFNLEKSIAQIFNIMVPVASKKGLLLERSGTVSKNMIVIGDQFRFERILTNLVGNAIKYTEKGKVGLDVQTKILSSGRVQIKCDITDTGIGIAEDKIDKIFEKFAQADSSITRRFGGTGLGLAITKHLIELMDGSIKVESVLGEGSVFTFTVTLDVSDMVFDETEGGISGEDEIPIVLVPVSQAKILVAEDHMMNQVFVKKLLQNIGVGSFDIVENGALANEALKNNHYDLVLMDCHMPERSGYDATIEQRLWEKQHGGHVPIVAMTANAMIGDRQACLDCGMDEYISKPVDKEKLYTTLNKWIDFSQSGGDAMQSENEAPSAAGIINLSALRDIVGSDKEMEAELLTLFIKDSEQGLGIMAKNQTAGPNAFWRESAHKLKGGAANIGAEKLRSYCEKAQHQENVSAQEREMLFVQIMREFEAVKSALLVEIGYG